MYLIKLNEQEGKDLQEWLVATFQEKQVAPSVVARLIHELRE